MQGFSEALMGTWPLILMFIVIYFFFLRPQSQKAKAQEKFSDDIQKGQDIVTTSGILGKITKIEEGIVTIQLDAKSYMRVTKNAISKELTEVVYNNDSDKGKA